jgi:hypothetical protein
MRVQLSPLTLLPRYRTKFREFLWEASMAIVASFWSIWGCAPCSGSAGALSLAL